MHKLIALVLGPVATVALVYSFGFVAMGVCFALALATLVFSNAPGDEESMRFAAAEGAGEPSTFMGGI